MEILDSKNKMLEALKKVTAKVEAVRKLPEYAEFVKYREEHQQWQDFVEMKRIEKTYNLINELTNETYGQEEKDRKESVDKWLKRLSKHKKKQSDLAWKRGCTYCDTNVMDHVWEVFRKYGTEHAIESNFGGGCYRIGNYAMEIYHGQGEYGYAIYFPERIY